MERLLQEYDLESRSRLTDAELERHPSVLAELQAILLARQKGTTETEKDARISPINTPEPAAHQSSDVQQQQQTPNRAQEEEESDLETLDGDYQDIASLEASGQGGTLSLSQPLPCGVSQGSSSSAAPSNNNISSAPLSPLMRVKQPVSQASPSSTASQQEKKRVKEIPRPRKAQAPPLVFKSNKTRIWPDNKSVFVVARGHEMTSGVKKALEAKVVAFGGSIAQHANMADFVVVPDGTTNEYLDKEVFKRKSHSSSQILCAVPWLRAIIDQEKWIDPSTNDRFLYQEFGRGAMPEVEVQGQPEDNEQSKEASSQEEMTQEQQWAQQLPEKYRSKAVAIDLLDSQSSQIEPSGNERNNSILEVFSRNSAAAVVPASGSIDQKTMLGPHGGQLYVNRKRPIPKETLACQMPPTLIKEASAKKQLNARLLEELGRMAELNEAKGDQWRAKSYSQAVAIIRSLDFEVKTSAQIKHRKGIGKNMAAHIDEVLSTGLLEKRVAFEQDPINQALVNMKHIYGVGEEWASRLVRLGFHDISSLRVAIAMGDSRVANLSRAQLIGVKHYEDLQKRMPRAEMESILNFIKQAARIVYDDEICSELVMEIVGSYRRGKDTSGDIDIIITSPSRLKDRLSIAPLIRVLQKEGLITDVLTLTISRSSQKNDTSLDLDEEADRAQDVSRPKFFIPPVNENEPECETFMGVCKLPPSFPHASGFHRRIDIKSYPAATFAFALLYFTGSAHFNRSMRYYAKTLGFSLSDKGMAPCTRFSRDKVLRGASILCRTEQDIFNALGLEYRAPPERNCDEIVVAEHRRRVNAKSYDSLRRRAEEIEEAELTGGSEVEPYESSEDDEVKDQK